MSTLTPFVVIACRRAKKGMQEQLLEQIDDLMQQASQEDGFLCVDVLQAIEDPSFITHYERWEDQELHDLVDMGPIHRAFVERAEPLLAQHLAPQHYTLYRRYVKHAPGQQGHPEAISEVEAPAPAAQPRLPYADPTALIPVAREAFENLPVHLHLFQMLAHAQTAFKPLVDLTTAMLAQLKLHPRLRELAILQVAHLSGATYEWVQHVPLARREAITEEQIAVLKRGEIDAPILNGDERLVLHFVTEAHNQVRVSDPTFAQAAQRFSPQELIELLLITGMYMMVARVMRSTDLPLDPPANVSWPVPEADAPR